MSVSRLRPVAVLLLALHLGACTTWQPVPVSPSEYIEAEAPYKIRFRDSYGAWLAVNYPRVVGDTISGTTPRKLENGKMGTLQVRMAVTDMPPIEAKRVNTPQTVIATATVSGMLIGAILCATGVACSKGGG